MTLRDWKGGPRANFAVHYRYGRDHQRLIGDSKAQKNPKFDRRTGIMWGRCTEFEDKYGWQMTFFELKRDAISCAKEMEYDYQRPSNVLDLEQRQLEIDIYGGCGKYLELYVADKYGNVFWDYPKSISRPIVSFLISRYRWRCLLQPEYRSRWPLVNG